MIQVWKDNSYPYHSIPSNSDNKNKDNSYPEKMIIEDDDHSTTVYESFIGNNWFDDFPNLTIPRPFFFPQTTPYPILALNWKEQPPQNTMKGVKRKRVDDINIIGNKRRKLNQAFAVL